MVGPARFELATSTMSRLIELATTRKDTLKFNTGVARMPRSYIAKLMFPVAIICTTLLAKEIQVDMWLRSAWALVGPLKK